jgi:hypothetical protein
MKRALARITIWLFEAYASPTISGLLVNAYSWALDITNPSTPEQSAQWKRASNRRTLEYAADLLAEEPGCRWPILETNVLAGPNSAFYRMLHSHVLAADLRRVADQFYPEPEP